ncbi:MAG TPA: rod shape-determining protein MreC [Mariprofundaceae bacterium]|nr:rod shape-determining protein MreC [Mariprofundaceae bacterium]
MPLPRWRTNRSWLWVGLLLVLLLYIAAPLPIGQRLTLGLAPLIDALHAPAKWWQQTSLWFQSRGDLQQRLAEAESSDQKQAALVDELRILREENRQLRRLLSLDAIATTAWHGAKVIGHSPDKQSIRIMLRIDGARSDDIVASRDGLVGLVDSADRRHAVVRTILDASIAVPVTLPGTTLAALARGEGDHLIIDFIPAKQAPASGTVMVTSGSGGLFPAGIPVARVSAVEHLEGQIFVRVTAEPVAHWQRDSWLAVATTGDRAP